MTTKFLKTAKPVLFALALTAPIAGCTWYHDVVGFPDARTYPVVEQKAPPPVARVVHAPQKTQHAVRGYPSAWANDEYID